MSDVLANEERVEAAKRTLRLILGEAFPADEVSNARIHAIVNAIELLVVAHKAALKEAQP